MSDNPQVKLTDFFDHFQKATENGTGEINTLDEPVVPVSDDKPLDYYMERAKKAAAEPKPVVQAQPAVVVPTPAPVAFATPAVTEPQKFSFCTGSGDPPPGYSISESCANCEYYCGAPGTGHCFKFNFPCASNYKCAEYERCEPMMYFSHTENVYKFAYDLNRVDSQALSSYTESLQKGIRNTLASKGVNLSTLSSEVYIYDEQSADAAQLLSSAITDPRAYRAFVKVFSQYRPENAAQLLASAPDIQVEPDKIPTYLPLFKLAESMASSATEAYQHYEQLYVQKFGDSNYYALSQAVITDDMSGTITAPTYAGDTLATEDDYLIRLRKAAENRVSTLAAMQNRSYTQEEVDAELERIQKSRPKLNTSI
jgi:hypothetical protein